MPYSAPTLELLAKLGIPIALLAARGLVEYAEATALEIAEVEANGREHRLAPLAAQAWLRMKASASAAGTELRIVSAFRSVARQVAIIERKLGAGQSVEEILAVSAAPGFSEHHTGLAIDIGTPGAVDLEQEFEQTPAFAWLNQHAAEFGFQLSYPPGNSSGYDYEPWHWRFTAV